MTMDDDGAGHTRRPRYAGTHPRTFAEKYKELDPSRYPAEARKVLASGHTPAGTHVPIMVDELIQAARPAPGELVVDCTLGGGGHALALLERVQPGGRLIGLDVDSIELPRTEARIRAAGYGPETFTAHPSSFAGLASALGAAGAESADIVVADLGVSSMQLDDPRRGFSYKGVGPLDMRMNPARGEPASALIARLNEPALAGLLEEGGDEPHATLIASMLVRHRPATTHAAERVIRTGLAAALPHLSRPDIKLSLRRTFQALRIAVNHEFEALDALLRVLPSCLAPGGRVVFITFHSGEDRRVKKAFQAGARAGLYADVARDVIRSSMAETRANRRSTAAKLRWAVRPY